MTRYEKTGQNNRSSSGAKSSRRVAGLMQINVRIPGGIPTGAWVPVAVRVGNASAQAGVTIAVR